MTEPTSPTELPSTDRGPRQGERRIVTALFCDVVESTSMAEQLDPEDWAELMNDAFRLLGECVRRYDGTVARFMGDGLLALFGAPIAHEDDPERAALSGLAMMDSTQKFSKKVKEDYGLDFQIRVGINTGSAVVGEVGPESALEYTALGDAVNVAARMEQSATPGSVQISGNTHRLIAGVFEFEPLGKIPLKGKSDPVDAYRVLRRRDHVSSVRGIESPSTPLVGRAEEILKLEEALAELRRGRGQIVFLIAEAGLGKSRINQELQSRWENAGGEMGQWTVARGVSYETERPYGLLRSLVRELLGLGESETLSIDRLQSSTFAELLSSDARPALEALLSGGAHSDEAFEGEEFSRHLDESMVSICRQAAATPKVIVLEDVHWADPASSELLGHLFKLTDELPLAFICSTRPERQTPGWRMKQVAESDYPHRYSEISLAPLTPGASKTLVDDLLGAGDVPARVRTLVLDKAEGNPLFVEEVIKSFIDSGAIVVSDGESRWVGPSTVDDVSIPDTVQALLVSRIDRLDPESRDLLQLASVIGRSFRHNVLEQIIDSSTSLTPHLATLQRVDLIRESAREPDLRYTFKHELTRDAAYATILRRRRPQFHQRVGGVTESLYEDRLEEEADRLAYHFAEAGDDERALTYQAMAAASAARLYANAEAITHFSQAIETLSRIEPPQQPGSDRPPAGRLHLDRGKVYERTGEFDLALADYEAAIDLARRDGNAQLEWEALAALGFLWAGRDYAQAGGYFRDALEIARGLDDRGALATSLNRLGNWEANATERPQDGLALHQEALAIFEEAGDKRGMAETLDLLGMTNLMIGNPGVGGPAIERAIELFRELNALPELISALTTSAEVWGLMYSDTIGVAQGKFDLIQERLTEARGLAQNIGLPSGDAYAAFAIGAELGLAGKIGPGLEHLAQALQISRQMDHRQWIAGSLLYRARVYNALLLVEDARSDAEEALPVAEEVKSWHWTGMALAELAVAFVHAGQPDRAKTILLDHGFDVGRDPTSVALRTLLFAWAGTLRVDGDPKGVLDIVDRLVESAPGGDQQLTIPALEHLRGQALLDLGRLDEAGHALELARNAASAVRLKPLHWKIQFALATRFARSGDIQASENELQQARSLGDELAGSIDDPALRSKVLAVGAELARLSTA